MSSYCYQTVFENACGSQSAPSETVCSILLSTDAMVVTWTTESPFSEQPEDWTIEKNINGQLQIENTNNSNDYSVVDDILIDGRPTYRIFATAANGTISYSNPVQYQKGTELYFPTAFTPNNDQHNDIFLPVGNTYDQFRMIIYNRWGKPMFATQDATLGWDGTVDGKAAPPGNYTYLVEIQKASQIIYRKTGTFLLIR
jgi:gliding motility-associated-like protein